MIEIPPKFAGQAPVNPKSRKEYGSNRAWRGAVGLAEDVRYYGEWMKQEAFKRIGHLYPKVQMPNTKELGGWQGHSYCLDLGTHSRIARSYCKRCPCASCVLFYAFNQKR